MLRDVVCLVVKLSHHLYIPVIVRPSYAGPTHSICAQVVVVALNESFLSCRFHHLSIQMALRVCMLSEHFMCLWS